MKVAYNSVVVIL